MFKDDLLGGNKCNVSDYSQGGYEMLGCAKVTHLIMVLLLQVTELSFDGTVIPPCWLSLDIKFVLGEINRGSSTDRKCRGVSDKSR